MPWESNQIQKNGHKLKMPFSLKVEPEWNVIYRVKNAIAADPLLEKQSPDFIEATRLAAIELCENALKYTDTEKSNFVEFQFDAQNSALHIRVTNICTDQNRKQVLQDTIREIRNGDPFELYVQRLEDLKDNPDGFSRMGLYRVAYESEYILDVELQNNKVIVSARRQLES